MVEWRWKTNHWLQVRGRPGRAINMLVSVRHSIIGLNHPLPMLHCSTVSGMDGAAGSAASQPERDDLSASGLSRNGS